MPVVKADTGGRTRAAPFDRRAIPDDAVEDEWLAPDGWPLRRFRWNARAPRGSILFLTGRADFYEKYLETFAAFRADGWNVASFDWRGQGGSGRLGPHDQVGHIEDFGQWIDDLAAFWNDWIGNAHGPHVLLGHSMGGHLVLRALAERRVDPDAAVLSAPMLAPAGGGLPERMAHWTALAMCGLGRGNRRAWKASEKPLEPEVLRQRLLTNDAARYSDEFFWKAKRPELQLGPASWRWVEQAYRSARDLRDRSALEAVDTPVLILAAERDELVDHRTIERAHHLLPSSEMTLFGEDCAHEIYREIDALREEAIAITLEFLNRVTDER